MAISTAQKGASMILLRREPDGEVCEVRCVHPESVRSGRESLLPDVEYTALADTFHALADPTRAKIVYSLLHHELCTCDLAAIVDISEPAVSQHLKVLKKLRLIKSRREGKVIYHSLDDRHINTLLAVCLEHVHDEGKK
jgi:ArsR family transcriptional regulator, lead/cadmium/zinc/bismuth-responsive transcriptional repressor